MGVVQLRSGRWACRIIAAGVAGARHPQLLLEREGNPSSEMRCFLPADFQDNPEEYIAQLARDPDERIWADRKGSIWVLEPDRQTGNDDTAQRLRYGYAYCRERTPRKKQRIRWLAEFTLGTLTDEDVQIIITVAEIRRGARQWQRVADFLAEHRRF